MNNRLAFWMTVVFLAAGLSLRVSAGTTEKEVEEDNSLTSELTTPHKEWGKGWVRGPVRALFVVNGGAYDGSWFSVDTRLREVVELGQRFDISGDAVLVGGSGRGEDFLGMGLGQKRAERMLSKPYDVYVLANFSLEKLPPKFQYLIMEQVAKGAGLVCVGPSAQDFMIPKRRIEPLPWFLNEGLPALDAKKPAEVMSVYRLGKGRAVWLNYPAWALTTYKDFSWRGLAEYDYRMLWVGRGILWAASKEAELSVSVAIGDNGVTNANQSPSRGEVTIRNESVQPIQAKVSLEMRRASDGWKRSLGVVPTAVLPGQTSPVPVQLPRLRADRYFLDAVVKSDRGVEACGATAFTVTSDVGIDKVEMDRSFVERGDRITGKAVLRGTPPGNSLLRFRLRDSYERVLVQTDSKLAPGQSEFTFSYTADAFATILMRVEASLLVNGEEVEMKSTSFTVPNRRRGQFNFLQWDTPRDVLGYYAWQQMKKAGMSVCLLGSFGPSQPVSALQASDVSLVPYSTRILDPKDDSGYMKPCCWNDEPNVSKYVQEIVDNQKAHREHGVFVYSLGDEGVTLGCCVHPACLAAYRRYLASQYGTIDKLNPSWGSEYRSFDEVDLLDHKDNMETGALAKGMWARWYDRQAFARHNLMQFSGRFVKGYKKLDPEALTGFEGTGGFGDDYDAILGTNTFYSPYPSIGDDINRSAAPRELIRANWMGYSKTGDALSDAAWRMVMKGMDSVWYWMWTGVGSYRGYLTPTLDFAPAIRDLMAEMKPVRCGLGDLLLQSNMKHSGIAVFYNLPSALSQSIENSRELIGPEATHQTWTQLIYDLGLDFRYVTSAMLKRGVLTTKEFKVLLLPMSQAISLEEAEAIRSFVQAGGFVIADVRPGLLDGHCKPVTPGTLDEVFGLRRAGEGIARSSLAVRADLLGEPIDLQVEKARIDGGVQAGTAQALGHAEKCPLLLVNQCGKGRALLLNFQLMSENANEEQAAATRKFLRALFTAAGAKAPVSATDPEGGPLPLTETRVWQSGESLVFGLWRQMQCAWFSPTSGAEAGEPVAAKVTLPSARHVYDLRTRRYLGKVTEVNTRLRWGRASFFLALPYRISGVDVKLSSKTPKLGQMLTADLHLRIPSPSQERHALYVEVLDPRGQPAEWSGKAVILHGATGRVQVPIAYNDARGTWRLRATELFSNQMGEATWSVR